MGTTNPRAEAVRHLQRAIERIREMASTLEGEYANEMLSIADEVAADADEVEAELIEDGYIPEPITQH